MLNDCTFYERRVGDEPFVMGNAESARCIPGIHFVRYRHNLIFSQSMAFGSQT